MRRVFEADTTWAINAWTVFLGRCQTGRFFQSIEQVPKVKQPVETSDLFVAALSLTICNQRAVLKAESMIQQ